MNTLRKQKEEISLNKCLLQRKLQLRKQKMIERTITHINEEETKIGFNENEIYDTNNNINNDSIYKLTLNELEQSNKTENKIELKRYLVAINKVSLSGKVKEIEAKILNNFSSEKTQFIFNLLFANITTPYIINPTLTNINFQYECLSLLINLIIDTNKYNDIFYANLHHVYNHILTISTQPHLIVNSKQLQTIYYHFIWLLGNMIQGYNHPFPNNINIPQLISNIQIHYINEYQVLSYNIWLLSIYLDQVNIDTYFQFTCFIDSLITLIEQKHKEISIIIITNILQVISLLIKNELCFNYILDKYNFIITFLINSYHLYTTAQKTLINFIKYDKQSIIPQKFDIYKQIIFDILFTQTKQYENELIINTLKLFRYLIVITSSMEHNCLITKFINDKKTFSYFQMNYMYLSIDEHERKLLKNVYKILYELFDKGNIYIKEYLCENNLHMYMINEIKKIDNNNGHNNKLIVIILKCLASMLYFEKQSKNKINVIRDELENDNFDCLLLQFQMSKHSELSNIANMILNDYYNDELLSDEDNN